MALQMAIQLAGLKLEDYNILLAHLKNINCAQDDGLSSPSTRSDSSGISSGALSIKPSSSGSTSSSPPSRLLSISPMPETATEGYNNTDEESQASDTAKKPLLAIGSGRKKVMKLVETTTTNQIKIELPEINNNEIRMHRLIPEEKPLNLMANITDPRWQIKHPSIYQETLRSFNENKSTHFRFSDDALLENYPTRTCHECHFLEPSPYFFT